MAVNASTPFDLDKAELASMEQIIESFQESFNSDTELTDGGVIEARVIDKDERDLFLDIGQKEDGRCALSEFETPPAQGETIAVVVVKGADDGMIRLSHKEADRRISWQNIKEAMEADAILQGVVEKLLTHGYIVDHGGVSLFMPLSHSDLKTRRTKLPVGKEIDFKVLELKDRHRSAVVSHRRVVEERNDEQWDALAEKIKEGDIVEGAISKKVSFGLFIEIAGVEGLLHQSDISWKKFSPFKSRFKLEEKVHVKILAMDRENYRLSLGLKQLTEDPWEWARRELTPGEVVKGTVTSVTDYGAFVELRDGLEGLIHVSELSWSKRPKHPKKYVEQGQAIEAQLLAIDEEKNRISLGLKQLAEDPWDQLGRTVKAGEVREGAITSVTKFGAFVEVVDDIEGLIHFKDYSWDEHPDKKMLKKGDIVKFKILEISKNERRVSCGMKQLEPSPLESLQKKYKKGVVLDGTVSRIAPFGLFVDIGEGFEGLVHISRIVLRQDEKLEDTYKVGDAVKTILQNIDPENRRIVLSIKAYQQKQDQALMAQYMKKDDSPSTSSLGAFFNKDKL